MTDALGINKLHWKTRQKLEREAQAAQMAKPTESQSVAVVEADPLSAALETVRDENLRLSFEPFNDYFFDIKILDWSSKKLAKRRLKCGESTIADFNAAIDECRVSIAKQIAGLKP